MYQINNLREEIDKVDKEILSLIEKRMDIVKKVAMYKKSQGVAILDKDREKQVINKNLGNIKNKDYSPYIKDIIIKIMEKSKEYQKNFIENKSLYGLIGEKLSHSLSREVHGEFFNTLEMPGDYNILEVERQNLLETLDALSKIGFKGVNVTIPYKVEVMKFLQEISNEAKHIGSVNTIKFKDGKLIGYNTDYFGFKKTLEKNAVNVEGKGAVILGSGGASLMVYNYLLKEKASEIILVTRNKHNKIFSNNFLKANVIDYNELDNLKEKYIIINCTPCGMYPNINSSPVNKDILENFKVAVDLIYNPSETLFLTYAKEKGLKIINGLYMLIAQAVSSEEIWNDIVVEESTIDNIYNKMQEKLLSL